MFRQSAIVIMHSRAAPVMWLIVVPLLSHLQSLLQDDKPSAFWETRFPLWMTPDSSLFLLPARDSWVENLIQWLTLCQWYDCQSEGHSVSLEYFHSSSYLLLHMAWYLFLMAFKDMFLSCIVF